MIIDLPDDKLTERLTEAARNQGVTPTQLVEVVLDHCAELGLLDRAVPRTPGPEWGDGGHDAKQDTTGRDHNQ